MLWVEKYRPDSWNEIVGNDPIINEIESAVKSGEMGHMLFVGPAGTGKTTTATVIAKELYGDETDTRFKELNASDERGINTIRNKVKKFAGRQTLDDQFRIVFLDEADNLTKDAQQSLRRIMENYHETCRFILSGNYKAQVIPAIRSRCAVYEFNGVDQDSAYSALKRIADAEELDVDDEVLHKLTRIYDGDLRGQINKLQSLSKKDSIDPESLESGEDYIKLFNLIGKQNFMGAVRTADQETLQRMYNYMLENDNIPGVVKAEVSVIMAKYDWRMERSADEQIQLNALVSELITELSQYIKNE